MDARQQRRWFAFSLRTLLVVVTLLCAWLGWTMHRLEQQRAAVAEVERLGGIFHHWQDDHPPEPPGPKWLRQLLGDDFFTESFEVYLQSDQATDETLAIVANMPLIRSLHVQSSAITDRGLAYLSEAHIVVLSLESPNVTAAGYVQLTRCTDLRFLAFNDLPLVTDAWLPELAKLTQVRYLYLNQHALTEEGLLQLRAFTHLRQLGLNAVPNITDDDLAQLQQALPNCEVFFH